jgi:uncharacterized membrane protein
MQENYRDERIRTLLLSTTMAIICTVLMGVIFSIFIGHVSADKASQSGDKVPQMRVGDIWTFYQNQNVNQQIVSQGVTMTITNVRVDVTYTVIEVKSDEYKVSVNSKTTSTGTWSYSFMGQDMSGSFTDVTTSDSSKSYEIYRASDMALKSTHTEASEIISLGSLGTSSATVIIDETASPPLNQYGFTGGTLDIGDQWTVTSTVSSTIKSTPQEGAPQTESTTVTYNVNLKVEEIKNYDPGTGIGPISCFRISQSGTKTSSKLGTSDVSGSLYFSTDTKSLVYDEAESKNLTSYTLITPKPDLKITSQNIKSSKTYPTVGDTVVITANVSNIGAATASNVIVKFYDGTTDLEKDTTIPSINGSSSKEISVNWTPTTAGDHTIKVVIDKANIITETDETNNEATITITVEALQPYNVKLEGTETQGTINSGGSLNFTVSVINKGTSDDTIYITTTGAPTGWTATRSKSSVDLNPNESTNVTVTVTAPQSARGGTMANIVVKGTSKGNPGKIFNYTYAVTVNIVRGILLTPDQASKIIIAGASTTYAVTVKNTGNTDDDISLTTSDAGSWSVSMSHSTISLPPNTQWVVNITINPPAGASVGEPPLVLEVTATSQDGVTSKSITLTTTIKSLTYGVGVSASPERVSIEPNGRLNSVLTIKNTGNMGDTIKLEIKAKESAAQSWTALDKTSIDLGAGKNGEANISITPSQNALAGTYEYTIYGNSTGSSAVTNFTVLTIEVIQVYGVSLTLISPAPSLYAGESTNCTLTIRNKGNGPDTFGLSITNLSSDWSKKFIVSGNETDNVTLGSFSPSNTTTVILSLTAPSSAKGSYTITVKSDSQGNSSESSSMDIVVSILPMGIFEGTVTDKNNNKAISGATIAVKKGDEIIKEETTDDDGHYRIEVKPGTYNLTISKSGYVNNTKKNKDAVAGVSTEVSVNLEGDVSTPPRPDGGDNFITLLLLSGAVVAIIVVAIALTMIRRAKIIAKGSVGRVQYQIPTQEHVRHAPYQTSAQTGYAPYAPPYEQYSPGYPTYQQQPYREQQTMEQNTVKCYNCGYLIPVTSSLRPLTVYCPACGCEGILD